MTLLMIFTVSRIHQHFSFLTRFRPLMLLTLLVGFYALANPRSLGTDLAVKTRSFRLIMAMAVMACLSTPFGISMGNSGTFILSEFSKTVLFSVLVLVGIRHSDDLYRFIWAFVIAAGCLAYLGIFVFRMQGATGDPFVRIQTGYSYDSNDIALVCVLGLVLALLTYTVSGKRGKLASVVVMIGLGMTIARTGSRGGMVALVATFVPLLVLLKTVSLDKKLGFLAVVGVGLIFAAPPGYWAKMATIAAPQADYNWTSETGRKEVFLRGMGYMLSRPLTGLGIDNFGHAEGLISDRALAQQEDPTLAGIKWSAAHNSYVQAGAEMGIPGMVLFLMLVFGSLWQCVKLRKRMPSSWAVGDQEQRFLLATTLYLPVAIWGFGVGGFFVSFAYLDPIYVLVAFVGGLHIAFDARMRREANLKGASDGTPAQPVTGPRRYRGGLPPVPPRQPAQLPPPVIVSPTR